MKSMSRFCCAVLLLSGSLAYAATEYPTPSQWQVGPPLFFTGPMESFDAVAVKDPSLVFFNDQWHLFYTARGPKGYSMGYAAASTLEKIGQAQHHPLPQLGGNKDPYAAAPQVFYFEPQALWYLVYQTRDRNYQPVYATTKDISNPESWTSPQHLCEKDEPEKWIDFWVICDERMACLFYTRAHKEVWLRSTKLSDYPEKFSAPKKVFENVHEAVHLYKVRDKEEYHMIYELRGEQGNRSFGLAIAEQLSGPWKRITDNYATGTMLSYSDEATPWTHEISHGEALRTGFDQRMEYLPSTPWLIQGLLPEEHQGDYTQLPWKLGLISPVIKNEN